jgi:hypothetical protein
MYNLAKLLTDEPEKLERLIILFLKLIITLYLAGLIFNYDFTINSLVENPLPKTLTTSKLILFFVSCIAVWFVFWSTILELLLCEGIVWLFTKWADKRKSLLTVLGFLGVIEERNGRIIKPKKYIILFVESLKLLQDKNPLPAVKTRLKQYYIISLGALFVLILSKAIVCGYILLSLFFILNMLVGCVLFNRVSIYIDENYSALIREFEMLAYSQRIYNTILESEYSKNHYDKPELGRKILLKRKEGYDWVPESIKVVAGFHWNTKLGQFYVEEFLNRMKDKEKESVTERYEYFISNIPLNENIISSVKKRKGFVYIYAIDDEEIFKGLEEAFFKMQEDYKLQKGSKKLEL